MSDSGELSLSAVRNKRAQSQSSSPVEQRSAQARRLFPEHPAPAAPATHPSAQNATAFAMNASRFLHAFRERRAWLLWSAMLFAGAAFCLGYLRSNYSARVTLISRDASAPFVAGLEGEAYRPRQLDTQTLVSLMESPELARRVAAKAKTEMSQAALAERIEVKQVRDTELVAVHVKGKDRKEVVDFANLYAEEAVNLSKELQTNDSGRMSRFCQEKIREIDQELKKANDQLIRFQNEARLIDPDAEKQAYIRQLADIAMKSDNSRIEIEMVQLQEKALQMELAAQNPVAQKLQAAQDKLSDLLTRLTEAHPFVVAKRREIAELEKQLAESGPGKAAAVKFNENTLASTLYLRLVELQTRKITLQKELEELAKLRQELQQKVTGLSKNGLEYANLKAQVEGLQKSRSLLSSRQREAQLYEDNAQGYYRIFAAATLKDVDGAVRWKAGALAGLTGIFAGILFGGLAIVGAELTDNRLKTAADVERVTGLRVLATLGDLNKMSAAEKEAWAFRTWTALSGQLNSSPNQGMICGFVSSGDGEGRSTWINLLVNAASQRGLRVLKVTTGSSSSECGKTEQHAEERKNKKNRQTGFVGTQTEFALTTKTLTPQALVTPAEATRELSESGALPAVHIPLPGWTWSPERRQQWQDALAHWRTMDDLVLFVELPPASMPEAVLLAENLPHVIWLADSGKSRKRATREQLETLRHAKCRLVGAVLNHEPEPVFEL